MGRQFKKQKVPSFEIFGAVTEPLITVLVIRPLILTFGKSAENWTSLLNFYLPRTAVMLSEKDLTQAVLSHSSSRFIN